MTLLNSLLDRSGSSRERRDISYQDYFGRALDLETGNTTAGIKVDDDSALRLAAVWSCVRVLAETIASLPVHAYHRDGDDGRRQMGRPAWLDSPNDELTRFELLEQTMTSLLLDGNAYCGVSRGDDTLPRQLFPLDPSTVTPQAGASGQTVYQVRPKSGQAMTLMGGPLGDIIHIRAYTRAGQVLGLSPIERARQAIGLGLATEQYGAGFFGRGSTASMVIESPKQLTAEQARELADGFEAHHRSWRRAHRPGVLTGGATAKPMSISPEHAQFLQTRKFQVAEIARLFRVPPHMIGDLERATFSNIEHQSLEFVRDSLRPWLVRLEHAFDSLLPQGRFARFQIEGLLRGDTQARYGAYATGRQWGWLSVNEIRTLEDLPPIDGGDDYMMPLNMQAVSDSVEDDPDDSDDSA